MYCHNCGKQIPDGTRFCHYCGAEQVPVPTPPPAAPDGGQQASYQQSQGSPDMQQAPKPEPQPAPAQEPKPEPQPAPAQAPKPEPQPATAQPPARKKKHTGIFIGIGIAVVALLVLGNLVNRGALGGLNGVSQNHKNSSAVLADLGDDPLSFTFALDGSVYQLPASYSVFADDGWKLKEDAAGRGELPQTLPSGETCFASLKRGDAYCDIILKNVGESPVAPEECYVIQVGVALSYDTSMMIPEGIRLGMTWKKMHEITDASSTAYYVEKQGDIEYLRCYLDPDSSPFANNDFVEIQCSIEQDAVTHIFIGSDTMAHSSSADGGGEDTGSGRASNDAYFQLLEPFGYQSPTHVLLVEEGLDDPTTEYFVRYEPDGTYLLHDYGAENDIVVNYIETIIADLSGLTDEERDAAADRFLSESKEIDDLGCAEVSYSTYGDWGILTFHCTGLDQEENWRALYSLGVFDQEGPYSLSAVKQEELADGFISMYQ